MGFLLTLSRIYLPRSVRRNRLERLFRVTAAAFQCPLPPPEASSFARYLLQYAAFTAENAEKALRQGRENMVKASLYSGALGIGQDLRRDLNIHSLSEVMQACEVIYKALGINFHGDSQGQIRIPECFFSSFYSADICRLISSLDEGLLAGLSAGLKLEFTQRITEGCPYCKAHLLNPGESL